MNRRSGRTRLGPRVAILSLVMVTLVAITSASTLIAGCGSDANVDVTEAGAEGATPPATPPVPPPPPPPGSDGQAPPPLDAGPDVTCLDASPDADIDCTGRCGPVTDPCSGKTKQCGGCVADDAGVRVCDLGTNTCIKPKATCADLGAECGTVKNSCGDYLDCPDTNPKGCPAGKECDPDTRKCRDCQNVTCADLGFQCGFAFLGCGTDIQANYTDCGNCAPDPDGGAPRVCNTVFKACEPQCTPKTAAQLCADAKTKRGLECGIISNGCGGTVNCDTVPSFGCAGGESCGVRGIANRCDKKTTPDECVAVGKECGDITSACSGAAIHCGDCASNEVCNTNGICGKPCTAKTCADFAAFECGTFDDTCGGIVKCGTCPSGVCDDPTRTCCNVFGCATSYAGKCGTSLPNGCGTGSLNCGCSAPALCTTNGAATPAPPVGTPGMCCTPKKASDYTAIGQCGGSLSDGCGGFTVNALCAAGTECVNNLTGAPGSQPPPGVVGTCCTRTDSCNLATGTCGLVQDSCRPPGTGNLCDKCIVPKACNNSNTCCVPAAACTGSGAIGGECNVTHPPGDPGCGSPRNCDCNSGLACFCTNHVCTAADGAGVCLNPLTCASPGYSGHCGTSLSNGAGGTIPKCQCPFGQVCSTAVPGIVGNCACPTPTGIPYDCTNVPNGPSTPGADACGTFDNGCGGTITCGCSGTNVCNTAPNPNTCCAPSSCPAPAVGSLCGALSNSCGGTNSCGCPATTVCNTTVMPNVCCAPSSCPASPGVGSACGIMANGCGGSNNCTCPSGVGNENFTCGGGTCACVKDTCRGRTGAQSDRCGGALDCGG